MKILTVLVFLLLASPCIALDSTMSCDTMAFTDGTDRISSTNTLVIADSATGYAYIEASMWRSGAFGVQMKTTCANALALTLSLEVVLRETGEYSTEWTAADNDGTTVTLTSSGATTADIGTAKRLRATIPGQKIRVVIVNGSGAELTITGGVVSCW